jgi:hypothetical protein
MAIENDWTWQRLTRVRKKETLNTHGIRDDPYRKAAFEKQLKRIRKELKERGEE